MRKRQRGDSCHEGGAALVEMAVVMPLVVLIMFGMLEFGMAFRDVLTVNNAVRDATRLLSAKGNDPDADCATILAMVDSLLLASRFDDLDRIEIFRADASGDQLAAQTNIYRFTSGDRTDCEDWTTVQELYPSISRQVTVGSTALDIVGVRAVYRHDWVTGFTFFSGGFDIDASNINRVEPEIFE